MADARHFCPDCGNIDLVITESKIITAGEDGGRKAECRNCSWSGTLTDTIGAVTSQSFWDWERVANVLLRVTAKHAAGPMMQVFEFVGILSRKHDLREGNVLVHPDGAAHVLSDEAVERAKKHNDLVDRARDAILKKTFAAALIAAFEEAENQHRLYSVEMNTPLHEVFDPSQREVRDRVFGGDVVDMEAARRNLEARKE